MKFLVVLGVIGLGLYLYFFKIAPAKNPFKHAKLKQAGDGQHGTARWGDRKDLLNTFTQVEYRPDLWRQGKNLPTAEGIIVHCEDIYGYHEMGPDPSIAQDSDGIVDKLKKTAQAKIRQTKDKIMGTILPKPNNKDRGATDGGLKDETPIYAYVDTGDVHTLMIGAAGIGKTAFFLYPNIEYCCAVGMSFLTTDTKGDLYTNTGTIAEKYYGYDVKVIDLRHPLQSSGYNMLYQVNAAMRKYLKAAEKGDPNANNYYAKAEKYAKIASKTIIMAGQSSADMGQNAYFYDSAEGITTAVILALARYGLEGVTKDGEFVTEKHIVSVFKLIQAFMQKTPNDEIMLKDFLDFIRADDRAKMYAAAALESAPETMQSVISTAMSKLLSFLDAEMEQIICHKNEINVEKFAKTKTAIYIVLPEEDPTKFFIASLLIQQIYQELLIVASDNKEHPNTLDKRVMFYCDEIGTMPKIDGLEAMFSAARSRKISIVAIVQLLDQFERTYGKESANIIADNCQLTIFGGFAPTSDMAKKLSESLGKQTVETESVSYKKNGMIRALDTAESYSKSMIERPLMTEDELKNIPKGNFVVMKTGSRPFRTRMKLFLRWGIKFEKPYSIPEKPLLKTKYADPDDMMNRVVADNPNAEDVARAKGYWSDEDEAEVEGD